MQGSSLDMAACGRSIKKACDLDSGMGRSHPGKVTLDKGRSLR